MSNHQANRPALPEGYYYPDEKKAAYLHAELQRELPFGHLLYGVPVKTFAARDDRDDTLFQHRNESTRFTVVHLTWKGKSEINEKFPTVVFDGTFADFLAYYEERGFGLTPQNL